MQLLFLYKRIFSSLQFVAILAIIGFANAGYLGGYSGLGYSGHSSLDYHGIGYAAPVAYTAPVFAKAVIPAVYSAPAVSHVSSYQVHAPIVKSYVAPVSYGGYGYGGHGYGGHGFGVHGYGGHGYGSKYLW